MWTEVAVAGISVLGTLGGVALASIFTAKSANAQRDHERSLQLLERKRFAYSQFEQIAYGHLQYVRAYKDAVILHTELAIALTDFIYKYRTQEELPAFTLPEVTKPEVLDSPFAMSILTTFESLVQRAAAEAAQKYPLDPTRRDNHDEVDRDNALLLEVLRPLAARVKTLPVVTASLMQSRQQCIEADQVIRLLGSDEVKEAAKPIYSALLQGVEKDELHLLMRQFIAAARRDLGS